ncbi:MAG TPA: quinone-dependent dihydroorotate dehydrogenase [Rhodospirillaceae bacterium]|jgi:dihydroorotate dehydrogenase|nr:quinone-dependent dihydroorotate dehydrogenase [Alphaproteobacteria bacterium]HBH26825.1 quinone-dependent dihydroorotate dehydrogenase [Rhodospirillaceae bacterium]
MLPLGSLYRAASPLLFAAIPPESAHGVLMRALRMGAVPACPEPADPALKVTLWGRTFPNPVGLAAGFDKDAAAVGPLLRLGFGFVEAGTVTPRPQAGNPRPRIFRAPGHRAVINRMGFPGGGAGLFKENMTRFLGTKPRPPGVVGVNIGMNKDQADPERDYAALIRTLGPMADYLAVNISSPNTPGLRDLQDPQALKPLLAALLAERAKSCGAHPPPLLVKLSPDIPEDKEANIARTIVEAGVDGLILTNTTLERPPGLPERFAGEKGGLSGAPLRERSTQVIRRFYALTGGRLPIIGVGGVESADDAWGKICAGASLVQVYTGLVYRGPWVAREICAGLAERVRAAGLSSIVDAVGTG